MTTKSPDRTLDVIRGFLDARGYPPSVRELAETLGVSVSTAHSRLVALRYAGKVEVVPGQARALRIVDEEEVPAAPEVAP